MSMFDTLSFTSLSWILSQTPNQVTFNEHRIVFKMLLMKYYLILTSPAPPAGPGTPPRGTENKTGQKGTTTNAGTKKRDKNQKAEKVSRNEEIQDEAGTMDNIMLGVL